MRKYFTTKSKSKRRAKKVKPMRNNIFHTTLQSYISPLRIQDTFNGQPVVSYQAAREVTIKHDLTVANLDVVLCYKG
jgi:hypothetical protein